MAIDINPEANKASRSTAEANSITLDPLRGCLTDGLRLEKSVDILIFNPPYVPTEEPCLQVDSLAKASQDALLEASWAGGLDGRYWIDQLLPRIDVPSIKGGGNHFILA